MVQRGRPGACGPGIATGGERVVGPIPVLRGEDETGNQVMTMGLFGKRKPKANTRSTVRCPECGSGTIGLGYVDRVTCTVLHTCGSCDHRWRDGLVDLADRQLAARR